jgi:flagellar motor switch protein FliG
MVDGATEKKIINQLEDEDYELAGEIIKRLFLFEDLVMLDDRAIQKVLREIDALELAKALKGAGAEVQRKIFRNMSKRAAAMLREEIVYMGPIRVKDVNEAQEKIIAIVRHLEDMGEIIISRSAEDELVIGTIFSEDSKNSGNSDLTGGV